MRMEQYRSVLYGEAHNYLVGREGGGGVGGGARGAGGGVCKVCRKEGQKSKVTFPSNLSDNIECGA